MRGQISRTGADAVTDPRELPAYTLAEAAHYLRLPPATLRSWVIGRRYATIGDISRRFRPLFRPAGAEPPRLSFSNLIEAHVLRSLRTEHGVPVKAVRDAIAYAERELNIRRLLLREELRTEAGRVFLERYGELIELSASGQLAMRRVLEDHLKRVKWDASHFPVQLFPVPPAGVGWDDRSVVIDARLAFGRPVVTRKSISTRAIAERIDAGESVEDVAADYELSPEEVEQAAIYERAA